MKKIWTRVIGTVLSVSMLLAGAPLAGAVDGLPTILRLEKDGPIVNIIYTLPNTENTGNALEFSWGGCSESGIAYPEAGGNLMQHLWFWGTVEPGKFPIVTAIYDREAWIAWSKGDFSGKPNPLLEQTSGYFVDVTVHPMLPLPNETAIAFQKVTTEEGYQKWATELGTGYPVGEYFLNNWESEKGGFVAC